MDKFIPALADLSFGNYIPLMAISLILLIVGADKLLDATQDLAKRFGTSEFIIGLTIVALGTSLPEIFVGIQSVSKGTENLAMGAIVGSNISNIALIFGVACIGREIYTKKNITSKRQYIPLITSAVLLGLFLYSDNIITPIEAMFIFLVLPVFLYVIYSDRSIGMMIEDEPDESKQKNVLWSLIILVISFVALYFGSFPFILFKETFFKPNFSGLIVNFLNLLLFNSITYVFPEIMISSTPLSPQTTHAFLIPNFLTHCAIGNNKFLSKTPINCISALAGFNNGPKILKIVFTFRAFLTLATFFIAE